MQEMTEAMFGLVKEQMAITPDYNKTVAVMCKCICKLVKGANFYNKGSLEWLIEEILSIFDKYYMNFSKPESAIHKVFKAMMNDALSNKPLSENTTSLLQSAL